MIYGFNERVVADNSKVLAERHQQNPTMQGLSNPTPTSVSQYTTDYRYHREGVYVLVAHEVITGAMWDATGGYWKAGSGIAALQAIYSELDPPPDPPEYRIGERKFYLNTEGTVSGEVLKRRVYNSSTNEYPAVGAIDDKTEFMHAITDAFGKLWIVSGSGASVCIVGRVVNDDLQAQSAGEIELFDENEIPTGNIKQVFNPHDVVFHKEITIPGEETPADRLIAWRATGWRYPVVYPYMLSTCEKLTPTFEPVEV